MAKKRISKWKNKIKGAAEKERRNSNARGYLSLPEGIKKFKPAHGKTEVFDILPYIVSNPRHLNRDEEENIALVGEQWYRSPFKIHRDIGEKKENVVCPTSFGKKCPICDDYNAQNKSREDYERLKHLKAKSRSLFAVVPKGHKEWEEDIHVMDMSDYLFYDLFDKELKEDEEYYGFLDLEDGYSIKVRWDSSSMNKKDFYAEAGRIDFKKREDDYKEEILKRVPKLDDLLIVLSYADLEALYLGMDIAVDEDVEEPEKVETVEEPVRKKKTIEKEEPEEESTDEEVIGEPEEVETDISKMKKSHLVLMIKEKGWDINTDQKAADLRKAIENKLNGVPDEIEKTNRCPFGFVFGDKEHFECHDECDDCEEWSDCANEVV